MSPLIFWECSFPHHLSLASWTCLTHGRSHTLVWVKNLAPDIFMTSVQEREVLCRLSYSLDCILVFNRRGIITLPLVVWTFGFGKMLFDVSRLLLSVSHLDLYIKLCSGDHFRQRKWWLLGEIFVGVSCLESILEHPHKYFLDWWDNLDDDFIKLGEIVPQQLWCTMLYIELDGCGHLHMTTSSELVNNFLYRLRIAGDRGTM